MIDIKTKKYIYFVIDDKIYALPILSLVGVTGIPKIDILKTAPKFIIGNVHMSKFNIPIVDLRLLLNKPNPIFRNKTCVIFTRILFKKTEKIVGFMVDSILATDEIQPKNIKKLPIGNYYEFIHGVLKRKEKMVFFLDLYKLINEDRVINFLNEFWNYEEQIIIERF